MEKLKIFDQNHGLNPFGKSQFINFFNFFFLQPRKAFFRSRISKKTFVKMSIFRLFKLLVFIAQKGVFLFQNFVKAFSWPILPKKKVQKIAVFGQKPWVNPFRKMSIFRPFELLAFIAQKGVFSFQNIIKDVFLANIA